MIRKALESLTASYTNDTLKAFIEKYNAIIEKEGGRRNCFCYCCGRACGKSYYFAGKTPSEMAALGCLLGAVLADYIFEPFIQDTGIMQEMLNKLVGNGKGGWHNGTVFAVELSLSLISAPQRPAPPLR